jgi:uncharacterized protein YcbK (DUF882 family)
MTTNFTFTEFIYGVALPAGARQMNDFALAASPALEVKIKQNAKRILTELQKIREKYGVPITINSGFRCEAWELHQGRSGASRHVQGDAVDFKCSQEVLNQIWTDIQDWNGGLAAKFRKRKGVKEIVFIHIDLGNRRRWRY